MLRLALKLFSSLALLPGWALAIITLFAWPPVSAEEVAIIGRATLLDAGTEAYEEHYFFDAPDPSTRRSTRVEYRQPDGSLLSIKKLHHGSHPQRPSFRQRNLLTGRLIDVKTSSRGVTLQYRAGEGEPLLSSDLPLPDNAVVDAGFDVFVRQNFEALNAGQRMVFSFLLPTRQRFVSLAIREQACDADMELGQRVCFVIRPESRLLSWFTTPIVLQYDLEERRLTGFRGLSNLLDARGEGMSVNIQYWYADSLIPSGSRS